MYNIVYQYNKQKHHQKNRPFDGVFDSAFDGSFDGAFATSSSPIITFIGIFHLHLWEFCSYIYGNFILTFMGIL